MRVRQDNRASMMMTACCVSACGSKKPSCARTRITSASFNRASSCALGYATDLGHVPSYFFDRFRDLDCIALEANYDPQMQVDSARPSFLKRRIMGGHGHLSNLQALAAIRKLLDRSRRLPDHIVLLHRSQECNCPDLVRQLFSTDRRIASRLTLAHQHERSPWLGRTNRRHYVGEQLTLDF